MSLAVSPAPAAPGRPGRSVIATWWYTWFSVGAMTAVFALSLILTIALSTAAPLTVRVAVIVLILLSAVASVAYLRHARPGLWTARADPRSLVVLLAPAAAGYVVTLAYPSWRALGALPLAIAVSVLCAERPRSWCVPLLVAIAVATVGHYWAATALAEATGAGVSAQQAEAWLPVLRVTVLYIALIPAMVLLSLWLWNVVRRLDGARMTEAELAVARERLRFAADLHDIQGHHLQVIALKTELAERLLDRDPEAARTQLSETRAAARQALEETRGLVQGLRQVSLGEELENAADVLGAAGIVCERRAQAEPQDPEVRRLLGLAVREATTNLLRHASPTTASFVLSREAAGTDGEDGQDGATTGLDEAGAGPWWRLVVVNDGVAEEADPLGAPGTGLLGLRDRLAPRGGTVSSGSGDGRFRLEVVVPEHRAEPPGTANTTSSRDITGDAAQDAPGARAEETAT